jgi:hypothetical protein
MFVRSFLGLKSEKSEKSRDHRSRHSPHRETPHHSTRQHHPRRRERSERPGYASERDFDDSDDYNRRDPYPRDRQGHGRRNSRPLYKREANRERLYDEDNHETDIREYYRAIDDERNMRDFDMEHDNERDGRQSERRGGDGGYRSPSISRALHIQAGETRQEMQDRVDGHSRRPTNRESGPEPRRSPCVNRERRPQIEGLSLDVLASPLQQVINIPINLWMIQLQGDSPRARLGHPKTRLRGQRQVANALTCATRIIRIRPITGPTGKGIVNQRARPPWRKTIPPLHPFTEGTLLLPLQTLTRAG